MTSRGSDDPSGVLRAFAETCGDVFASFGSQDSGCVSFGVEAGNRRWFIKGPTTEAAVDSVTSSVEFHARVRHAVIVRPVEIVEIGGLPVLRYPWVDGETLYHATTEAAGPDVRTGGDAPHQRFRQLPVDQIVYAIDAVYAAHVEIVREGFVAVDLYDGCLHYDFARRRMRLIDLDEYRPGPFEVPPSLLPGSTRFRSPEETTPGAVVDERSTVYALGRVAQILLDEGDDDGRWRASDELAAVAGRATQHDPVDRYGTVTELAGVWRASASIAD